LTPIPPFGRACHSSSKEGTINFNYLNRSKKMLISGLALWIIAQAILCSKEMHLSAHYVHRVFA
jgi:hypothetical protein